MTKPTLLGWAHSDWSNHHPWRFPIGVQAAPELPTVQPSVCVYASQSAAWLGAGESKAHGRAESQHDGCAAHVHPEGWGFGRRAPRFASAAAGKEMGSESLSK